MSIHPHTWRHVRWLRGLDSGERSDVLARSHRRQLDRGAEVAASDVTDRTFCFVMAGVVKIGRRDESGRTTIVQLKVAGELVQGAHSWLGGPSRTQLAALVDRTELLLIPRDEVMALTRRSVDAAHRLTDEIASDCGDIQQRLVDIAVSPVPRRIARLMEYLAAAYGVTRDDGAIDIPFGLSRQDIADLSATTVETAIRVLRRLHEHDIVVTERHHLVVADVTRLRHIGSGAAELRAR